jgi:hypothetical protein
MLTDETLRALKGTFKGMLHPDKGPFIAPLRLANQV